MKIVPSKHVMTLVISVSQSCIQINLIFFFKLATACLLHAASEGKCEVVSSSIWPSNSLLHIRPHLFPILFTLYGPASPQPIRSLKDL